MLTGVAPGWSQEQGSSELIERSHGHLWPFIAEACDKITHLLGGFKHKIIFHYIWDNPSH
jgi:hypothetical protein